MSKLSDKFASAKKELAERAASVVPGPATSSSMFPRAAGPLHGSVSTMKLDMLKSEIEVLKAGTPVLQIDPKLIRASSWANRHEDSFVTDEFLSLKEEIKSAGENIQPIKVRSIDDGSAYKYEIVFGHRRHRACLDLEIGVNAIVDNLDEKQLFIQMDRENRQREDLSPYEQGVMYAKAIDTGLFPSIRKLADDIGIDATGVSKTMALAKLPTTILDCFESRIDLQYRWGAAILKVLESEPDLVLARAKDIKKQRLAGSTISSKSAFELLTGKLNGVKPDQGRKVTVGEKSLTITEHKGQFLLQLDKFPSVKMAALEKYILNLMSD